MKRSIMRSVGQIGLCGARALALSPSAFASDDTHTVVIPTNVAQGGSIFVVETVIHNVSTGERAVVSEECEASGGAASPPALNCIQAKPDPAGMQIYVKTIRPGG